VFKSILANGLLLTHESIDIAWDDPYGKWKSKELQVVQYRLCLTALHGEVDIAHHSVQFGPIAIGFSMEFIRMALGGTPVFYLPSPTLASPRSMSRIDDLGISLLYRLAEIRQILEAVEQLPETLRSKVAKDVVDLENTLGAVRFLGNILYLTDYMKSGDNEELRYYKQREWRVIAGLCPPGIKVCQTTFRGATAYLISSIRGVPVSHFIEHVVIVGTESEKRAVEGALSNQNLSPRVTLLEQ
jgi:hypothetical protein